MDINRNDQTPKIADLARPATVYPVTQVPDPQRGFAWGWPLVGLALIALIVGGLVFANRSPADSGLKSLQARVQSLEQAAQSGNLSAKPRIL